ncbi:hypothetical protein pb186bvf_017196 [Paramecium bursaria]
MSNSSPSGGSGSSDGSIEQFGHEQVTGSKRPNRGKKKKLNSEQEFDSNPEDDEGSYEVKNKKAGSVPGIQNRQIQKKQENKIKRAPPINTTTAQTFLYKPGVELPNLKQYLNSTIEIRIASEYIDRSNPALALRQIWGSNGVYASHSDIVCIGVHSGMLGLNDIKAKSQLYQGVALYCKVIKGILKLCFQGKKQLGSALRAPLLSRSLKTQCAHCLKPERCQWLQSLGAPDQLINWASRMSIPPNRRLTKRTHLQVYCHEQPPLQNPENILLKNLPPFNQGWIIWDMCDEPATKYNLITFMDKQSQNGYESNMAYQLRNHALYIENYTQKFEILIDPKYANEEVFLNVNAFQIYELLDPSLSGIDTLQQKGVPLPQNFKKKVLTDLKWKDFEWGNDNVKIKDIQILNLKCFRLVPIGKN